MDNEQFKFSVEGEARGFDQVDSAISKSSKNIDEARKQWEKFKEELEKTRQVNIDTAQSAEQLAERSRKAAEAQKALQAEINQSGGSGSGGGLAITPAQFNKANAASAAAAKEQEAFAEATKQAAKANKDLSLSMPESWEGYAKLTAGQKAAAEATEKSAHSFQNFKAVVRGVTHETGGMRMAMHVLTHPVMLLGVALGIGVHKIYAFFAELKKANREASEWNRLPETLEKFASIDRAFAGDESAFAKSLNDIAEKANTAKTRLDEATSSAKAFQQAQDEMTDKEMALELAKLATQKLSPVARLEAETGVRARFGATRASRAAQRDIDEQAAIEAAAFASGREGSHAEALAGRIGTQRMAVQKRLDLLKADQKSPVQKSGTTMHPAGKIMSFEEWEKEKKAQLADATANLLDIGFTRSRKLHPGLFEPEKFAQGILSGKLTGAQAIDEARARDQIAAQAKVDRIQKELDEERHRRSLINKGIQNAEIEDKALADEQARQRGIASSAFGAQDAMNRQLGARRSSAATVSPMKQRSDALGVETESVKNQAEASKEITTQLKEAERLIGGLEKPGRYPTASDIATTIARLNGALIDITEELRVARRMGVNVIDLERHMKDIEARLRNRRDGNTE